ncbi:hypothetical protein EDC04DRAFT_2615301 [Pisolithus marmoratus]|nr:hypothetical protein EDC04DRAFT_2615301 [Pisolithus marmoratus]
MAVVSATSPQIDPPLVDRTLTRFSAQWWQDGDTGRICYGEFAGKLARIVAMDSQRESVTVIAGLNCGFQGIVIGKVDDMYLDVPAIFLASHVSPTTYISREPDNQVPDDPLIRESRIQPGDFVRVISGPHKGLCGTLHWHSGREILITLSTLQQADPDNLGDKGKSRAQEPEVLGGDGDIDEGSDLIQVSVSMDEVLIIPPSTLQFSREKGYDVTIGDHVRVARGPAVGIEGLFWLMMVHCIMSSSVFAVKLENHSLRDVERQVGHEVWIISGPRKGYRGTLRSVGRTYCNVAIESGIMQLKNTAVVTESGMFLNGAILDSTRMAAFIELRRKSFVWTVPRSTTPPTSQSTVDPSAESGPSTLACDPWVPHSDDTTPRPLNELAQAEADYGCVPWLFDNNFCDYANWRVCLRVAVSYNRGSLLKRVVHTTVPDLLLYGRTWAWLSTSWSCVSHCDLKYTCDLTPMNPRSAGQYCLVLHGELAGQIHQVKKCQVKKDPKGVELEDRGSWHHINVDPMQFMSFLRYSFAPKIMLVIH